ncbi:MAG: hypothetical protein NZ108_11320 [Bacteroidia bacterium]|nr:hypothetical protein [Bacteroidia bacterium]
MLANLTIWKGLLLSLAMTTSLTQKSITIDEKAAKEAFEYLNKVRANPASYSKEIWIDLSNIH